MMSKERNDDEKFEDIEGILKGQVVVDKISADFGILNCVRLTFKNIPTPSSYGQFTDLEMAKMKGPHSLHRKLGVWT